jgi:putative DNA primase/helicase|nr:MAG TPA: dsDNA helicase [Caudoviricetes sp.]
MVYYKKLIDDIVDNLVSVSDRTAYDVASKAQDYRDSSASLQELVYTSVSNGDLRSMNGITYFFTGKIYEPISEDVLERAIELFLVRMHVPNRDMYYSLNKFQKKAKQSLRLNCYLHPSFHVKAYLNGVVDMTTGVLHKFSPEFHVIYLNEYNYDPTAKCPLWNSFLRTVLPEKESRSILQMYLGLCTFDRGYMTDKVENCLMLYGNGSNGKSVIYETIDGIFGKPNVSGMGLLSLIKGGDERMRNIAAVDGKIVNVCPEIQAKDISGYEDAFKSLCSGEVQYGRNIGGNVYVVRNIPWLIFNMNNIPKSTDGSHGYFRRFLYIIFEHIIPEELQNKHLASDLKQEYPGILNWIMRGAKYLKQRKYVFPKSENAEKQRLLVMGESNVTLSWASARGVRCASATKGELFNWLKVSDMYQDMVNYAEANGFVPVDIISFGRQMTKIGFGKMNKKRTASGFLYKVYGFSEEELKTPVPVVQDMDLCQEDAFDKGVEYDVEDL